MCNSQIAGKNNPSSIWIFISLGGDDTKSQSNKKQTFLVTLFQGISYSNELKLGFITVQSERTNKSTITRSTCLMRATLKDPNRQQTPDFQRFKMNQQYLIIVIITIIILLSEAACQSCTFNIKEYNRHERQMDFKYALFLYHFYHGDTAGWVHWVMTCPLGPLSGAVFHVDTRQPSLFCVHTILCIYFNTLGWFCSLCV